MADVSYISAVNWCKGEARKNPQGTRGKRKEKEKGENFGKQIFYHLRCEGLGSQVLRKGTA